MARNYIEEIVALKSRGEFSSRYDFVMRLGQITNAIDLHLQAGQESNEEILKYIPIATVACFEAFFRSVIAELINFGEPYSENIKNFNDTRIKFDFNIVSAIRSDAVSLGEFISHTLPCKNFEDISRNVSTVLGMDFIEQIKAYVPKESLHGFGNSSGFNGDYFSLNYSTILRDVKKLYELRHIFCHEYALDLEVDKGQIIQCFINAKLFLEQSNEFIGSILYPNSPTTQSEMNAFAKGRFEESDNSLNQLIIEIRDAHKSDEFLAYSDLSLVIDDPIRAWRSYREAQAKADSSVVEGGSMYPTLYFSSMARVTEEKIKSLKKQYHHILNRFYKGNQAL